MLSLLPLAAHSTMLARFSGLALDYTADGYSSKGGGSLAFGTTLGATNTHEANLEIVHVPWSFARPEASLSPGGFLGRRGSGDLTPVLVNYRYSFKGPSARLGLYAGIGVGATRLTGDLHRLLSGVAYSGKVKKWTATGAVSIGLSATITQNISFDLGYRYLHIDGADVSSQLISGSQAGPDLTFEAPKAHAASLGLTFNF
jgi:opacity protein-like surface antigen